MQSETKSCQNYKKDFTIEPEDFNFYEKMKVPPPTFCSSCNKPYRFTQGELDLMRKILIPLPRQCFTCRQEIRFSRINLPHFYNRKCMKCETPIKTSYGPDRPEIVYCEKCYQAEFL